jgi:hypothetical protein
MKKILFPFETNQPIYKEAYVYAVKFARNLGAELIMLNVFQIDIEESPTPKEYKRIVRDNWFQAYQEIIKFNKHYLSNYARIESELRIKFDYRFLHGNFINEISKIISSEEIDLIVLPEAEYTESYKEVVKVVWHDVYEKDPVSLLLIPNHCVYQPIKSTAFVAEMRELKYISRYLKTVIRYAKVFDASVHFLHISHGKKDELLLKRNGIRDLIQTIESSNKHVFKNLHGRDIPDMIEEYTDKNHVKLLFVVRHHHYFFDSLFHKKLSDEICLKSSIPVLVMKE